MAAANYMSIWIELRTLEYCLACITAGTNDAQSRFKYRKACYRSVNSHKGRLEADRPSFQDVGATYFSRNCLLSLQLSLAALFRDAPEANWACDRASQAGA